MIDPDGGKCTCGLTQAHTIDEHDKGITAIVLLQRQGFIITGKGGTCSCGTVLPGNSQVHWVDNHNDIIRKKLKEEYENKYFNALDKAIERMGKEMDLRLQAFQGACRVAGLSWRMHADEMFKWLMRAHIIPLKLEDK
jgi:hypothetical protein